MEAAATSIDAHTVQLVHGLLQTEAYTRALAEAWRIRTEPLDVDALVAVRRTRQRMLGGAEPLRLRVVMHEGALRQMVGGPEVMRGPDRTRHRGIPPPEYRHPDHHPFGRAHIRDSTNPSRL